MKKSFKMLTVCISGYCLIAASVPQLSYAASLPIAEATSTVVAFPISASLNQQQGVNITGKTIKEQTAEVQVDILIPVIEGMKDTQYQNQLNDIISSHAMKDLENIKKQASDAAVKAKESGYEMRPHTLNIQYEVKADGGTANANIISIKMTTYTYTGGANGMPRVDTYNVLDEAQAKRVELKEWFGDSYKDNINAQIQQEIAKHPENFFQGEEGFKGISDTQSFYIEKGAAVFVFQKYQIAPGSSGTPEFHISLSNKTSTGQQNVKITTKTIKDESAYFTSNLNIPVFEGLKDTKYQAQLNDIIERHAMEDQDNLKKQAQADAVSAKESGYSMRPYSLNILFEAKADGGADNGNMVSVKIITDTYTGGAHGIQRVDTYTVRDEPETSRVELKDLFGANYKEGINKQIGQEIAQHPNDYFKDSFKGISDTQSFYIEKGDAVILFSPYEIAPYSAGIPEFRIALPKESTAPSRLAVGGEELSSVEASIYISDNGTSLVPLRIIAERLGYNVKWNEDKQLVEINKGAQWTSLQAGKDSYIINRMAPLPLGQAPVIKEDGMMYVPLDFFSKILKAEVQAESGSISIK
ncbi:DUF4163 domain-containing protein [Paenibacillus sp. LMG 31456]|uniref:DUF4163 domain-containing protein n=1 Tax=Paenibacillus foliorum TaxID=2654974 RepID=A0A972GX68_9BACL|nr:DUF4163 domain-containing protein [Paenibacillus foliorum]NOU92191.1 DUF4163 domain-containing protein [Paenibacillus foliorum]